MISGERGVKVSIRSWVGSGCSGRGGLATCASGMGAVVPFLSADFRGWLVSSTSSTSFSSPGGVPGCESSSSEGMSPLVAMLGQMCGDLSGEYMCGGD